MLATTERLLDAGFKNQIIKEWNVISIFDGTPASRYGLINKALKKRELLRLYRGVYILSSKYRSPNMSKFYIASRMISGSYISFETALSYHGFIPEKVNVMMSAIVKGRTRSFSTEVGEFEYIKIPVDKYEFLSGILREELGEGLDKQPVFIAGPLRALLDYVYVRNIEWTGLDFLLEGLRIELESLETFTARDFDEIKSLYHSKRVLFFLTQLRKAMGK